jgi:hypothetical protein
MFKGRSPYDITIDNVINCQCSCFFVLLITSIQLKVFKKPWGGYDFKAPEGWQMRILKILELWRCLEERGHPANIL